MTDINDIITQHCNNIIMIVVTCIDTNDKDAVKSYKNHETLIGTSE